MAINANSGEYKARVGLDSLYVAVVSADSASAYTAGTPEILAPVAEATQEPSSESETLYADDKAFDVITAEGETKITLKVTGVPLEMLATITGRKFDSTSGRLYDYTATPPDVALSFRSKKSNGGYRYYQYLKGKFEMPKEEAATEKDAPDIKTQELTYTAVRPIYAWDLGGSITDSPKRIIGDTDTTNFSATGWFSQVQVPSVASPSALSLSSSSPADNATGVAVGVSPTLTFSNALVNAATAMVNLIKVSTGAVISATKTLDTAKTVMTIDPASNLDASSEYFISYAVTDVYGQTLSGVASFTTA